MQNGLNGQFLSQLPQFQQNVTGFNQFNQLSSTNFQQLATTATNAYQASNAHQQTNNDMVMTGIVERFRFASAIDAAVLEFTQINLCSIVLLFCFSRCYRPKYSVCTTANANKCFGRSNDSVVTAANCRLITTAPTHTDARAYAPTYTNHPTTTGKK